MVIETIYKWYWGCRVGTKWNKPGTTETGDDDIEHERGAETFFMFARGSHSGWAFLPHCHGLWLIVGRALADRVRASMDVMMASDPHWGMDPANG